MVNYQETEKTLHCVFQGRLDTITCQSLQEDLLGRISRAGGEVVFDLANVTYISSAFLRLCVQTAKLKVEGGFTLLNLTPDVKKVFVIAGLDKLFNLR